MHSAGGVESIEIERKYEIPEGAMLPDAAAFAAEGLVLLPEQVLHIRAEYFDTPDLRLGQQRIALRRRSGGVDDGWHIKEKREESARELWWEAAEELPIELRAVLSERIGAVQVDRLIPIATLNTERRARLVTEVGREEVALVELADDRVDSRNALTETGAQWREWEAELLPGIDASRLDAVEVLLARAGAVRVRGLSKIQRTMQLGTGEMRLNA